MTFVVFANSADPEEGSMRAEMATRKDAVETAVRLLAEGRQNITIFDETGRAFRTSEFGEFLTAEAEAPTILATDPARIARFPSMTGFLKWVKRSGWFGQATVMVLVAFYLVPIVVYCVANIIYGIFFGSPPRSRDYSDPISPRIPGIIGLLAAIAWTILFLKLLWDVIWPWTHSIT